MSFEMLKLLAMGTMFIDHIGVLGLFGRVDTVFRCIGRLSFPIYGYLVGSGFRYSKNKKAYIRNLGILALLSEIPYDMLQQTISPSKSLVESQNIVWLFFLASIVMYQWENGGNKLKLNTRQILITVICTICVELINPDYGMLGVSICISRFWYRKWYEIRG